MIGFRTARALVVDDKPDEAIPVIRALGKLGVSSVFSDATLQNGQEKHNGIRLLCLDMILSETRGVPDNDPNAAADALVVALGEMVQFSADPVIVVCFTREPDYVDAFKTRFEATFTGTPLLLVDRIQKEQMEDEQEVQNLVQRIRTAVGSQAPVSLFFGWEQMVHESATATTGSLNALVAQFTTKTGTPWTQCAFAACAALALAERGRRLGGEHHKYCLSSLYAILTAILADRLEHRVPPEAPPELTLAAETLLTSVKAELSCWDNDGTETAIQPPPASLSSAPEKQGFSKTTIELLRELARFFNPKKAPQPLSQEATADSGQPPPVTPGVPQETSRLPKELRASLNSALQLSFQVGNKDLNPGNVYLYKDRENQPASQVIGSIEDAKDNTFVLDRTTRGDVEPLFVEITPSCDFAQDKAKLPRFVLGFSFPPSLMEKFRRGAQYTRLIDGPLFLTRDHGMTPGNVRFIALNAHYVFALSQKNAKNLKPSFRLRCHRSDQKGPPRVENGPFWWIQNPPPGF